MLFFLNSPAEANMLKSSAKAISAYPSVKLYSKNIEISLTSRLGKKMVIILSVTTFLLLSRKFDSKYLKLRNHFPRLKYDLRKHSFNISYSFTF